MAICSHCGKEARSNEQFCVDCGRELLATGEAVYAASGAPLSWNSSQPQMADPSANGSSGGAYGAGHQARLVVRVSPTAEPGAVVDDGEREFLLDGRDIAVGRAPSCDIVLAGDQLASRRHALLRLRDDSYTVVDLGSSNGTYVNDEEIHAETTLNDGDRVTVGGHDLIFSTAPASASASIAGTLPAQTQSATLLETAPIAAVNVPQAAPPANAWQPAADDWQQSQDDVPLAEPEQLEDAGEPVETQFAVLDDDADAQSDTGAAPADEPSADMTETAMIDTEQWVSDGAAASSDEAPDEAEAAQAEPVVEAPVAEATSDEASDVDASSVDASSVDASSTVAPGMATAPAVETANATDLDVLRSQLAEISTALSRKADEENKLNGRLRAALVEVRDQLAALAREHGSGSYTSSEPTQDYSRLATIARQAADHPRHLDFLSGLSDAAGEIAEALESKQEESPTDDENELLSGIEALRARLDETLG